MLLLEVGLSVASQGWSCDISMDGTRSVYTKTAFSRPLESHLIRVHIMIIIFLTVHLNEQHGSTDSERPILGKYELYSGDLWTNVWVTQQVWFCSFDMSAGCVHEWENPAKHTPLGSWRTNKAGVCEGCPNVHHPGKIIPPVAATDLQTHTLAAKPPHPTRAQWDNTLFHTVLILISIRELGKSHFLIFSWGRSS